MKIDHLSEIDGKNLQVRKVRHDLVFSAIVVTALFGAVGDLQLGNQKFEEAGRFHHIHKQKIPS